MIKIITYKDKEFNKIINTYMENEKFLLTNTMEQHGTTRFLHSYRVSYYSYKIAKKIHLNYEACAVGGLLHDFFISPVNWEKKDRMKSYFTHPKLALNTSLEEFDLSLMEQDIIRSHMFPVNPYLPKYLESWIVSFVDKFFSTLEFGFKFRKEISCAYNLFLFFIIKSFK